MADSANGQGLDVGSMKKMKVGVRLGFGIPEVEVAEAQKGRQEKWLDGGKDGSCHHLPPLCMARLLVSSFPQLHLKFFL